MAERETEILPGDEARRFLARATAAYQNAIADQQRNIAQAAASKGHLGDGYWQPAHKARLRLLAATAVVEAFDED